LFSYDVFSLFPLVKPVPVARGKVWHLQLKTNIYKTTLGRVLWLYQQRYDGKTSAADIAARLKAANYAS
jgi:hypothetical protein